MLLRALLTAGVALAALWAGSAQSAQTAQSSAQSAPNAAALYQQHCASCHGADRLGGTGPALLPENLARLRPAQAQKTIAEGRIATQMPGFADTLDAADIQALTELIYAPLAQTPVWGANEMRASRIEYHAPGSLPDKPVFGADPLNLFVVVELGDHHATILDGDKFEPVARFATRYALHGGPKFSPDGRYVYFASRDGWIAKYDIWNLKLVAEIRAGINTRNLAVSSDGRYAMVANYLPHTLVVLDTRDLQPLKVIEVQGRPRQVLARVGGVRRGAAQELHRRPEGHSRKSGKSATTTTRRRSTAAWCTTTRWPKDWPSRGRSRRAGSRSTTTSTTSSSIPATTT